MRVMDEHLPPPTGASRPARWCLVAALQEEAAALLHHHLSSYSLLLLPLPTQQNSRLGAGCSKIHRAWGGRSQARHLQIHLQEYLPTLAVHVHTRGAAWKTPDPPLIEGTMPGGGPVPTMAFH